MIADFFTKPLQGTFFHRLRDVVMGRVHVNTLVLPTIPPPLEERVEKPVRPGNDMVVPGPSTDTGTGNTVVRQPHTNTPKSWADVMRSKKKPSVTGTILPLLQRQEAQPEGTYHHHWLKVWVLLR